MAFLHEGFTDEEIKDVLRREVSRRGAQASMEPSTMVRYLKTSQVAMTRVPDAEGAFGASITVVVSPDEVGDLLRFEARERAIQKGHPVASADRFMRKSNVVVNLESNGTYNAAVSWEDD
jgi:hypothetical protein